MNSLNSVWLNLASHLYYYGEDTHVRGSHTKEIIGNSVMIDMANPILTVANRNLSYEFLFREAWWILAGRNDVKSIAEKAPSIAKFSDDGERFFGAYGPKIMDQLSYVVHTLNHDPSSRQAVINIWREQPRETKDVPCTLSVQFLIRNGRIHTVVTMRSSDLWLGLPYDVFNFTMLTCLLGIELRKLSLSLDLGYMYHNAGSRHIYSRDYDKVHNCLLHPQENAVENAVDLKKLVEVFPNGDDFIAALYDKSNNKLPTAILPWL